MARKKGAELERITLYLPTELATKLRVRGAEDRRSLSSILQEALALWLKKNGGT